MHSRAPEARWISARACVPRVCMCRAAEWMVMGTLFWKTPSLMKRMKGVGARAQTWVVSCAPAAMRMGRLSLTQSGFVQGWTMATFFTVSSTLRATALRSADARWLWSL